MIYTYDTETYPNYILFVFIATNTPKQLIDEYCEADMNGDFIRKQEALSKIDYKTFVISDTINQAIELKEFVSKVTILVGFNSIRFDDMLLDIAMILAGVDIKTPLCTVLYTFANRLINDFDKPTRWNTEILKGYNHNYISIDMQKLLYLDAPKNMVSLKRCEVILKWYRVESLPIEPGTMLTEELKIQCKDYCINDVLATNELYWSKIGEVRLRADISREYGINVYSESRSGIANRILSKMYVEMSGISWFKFKQGRTERRIIHFRDIVNPKLEYKTPEFSKLLEYIKNTKFIVGVTKLEYEVILKGCKYIFKKGGIHSGDRPGVFIADSEWYLKDADISSFYPTFVINENVAPKHLSKSIYKAIAVIVTKDRLKNKHLFKTTRNKVYGVRADALKIVANSGLFGKLGEENSPFYDLQAMYTVTINGQLFILTLAEEFAINNIQVISANTDGIVCKIHKSKLDDYNRIVANWQTRNNMELEITDYSKYIRVDVNNYISIKTNGEIKRKGLFKTELDFDKGFNHPIVAIALDKYYTQGIPIKETILNHTDLHDFGISQKVGSGFKLYIQSVIKGQIIKQRLEKVVRVYVSNNGGSLVKIKEDGSETSILAGRLVIPFNNFIKKDMKDYGINYNYYIGETQKIIDRINGINIKDIKGTKSKPGLSGTLFDNFNIME